jgi:hypothetical protein
VTQVNWDALNQAARANEASRRSAEAVCAFAEALAERLDMRVRGPVSPIVSDVFRAVRDDLLAVVASYQPEPQAPVSRPPADWGTQCMDGRCLRDHDTTGRHTS